MILKRRSLFLIKTFYEFVAMVSSQYSYVDDSGREREYLHTIERTQIIRFLPFDEPSPQSSSRRIPFSVLYHVHSF